jgi:molybdopterin converting factor subunit 1
MTEREPNLAIDTPTPRGAVTSGLSARAEPTTAVAIVPAAGRSERMGRPKLLLTIGGQTVLSRVVNALRDGGAGRVLVVAPPVDSEEGPAILDEGQAAGAEVIVPSMRPGQMRDSIELALGRIARDRPPRWMILTPGDCPGITPQLVEALLDLAARKPECMIVPVFNEQRGHPVVLPWDLAAEIPKLPAGAGVNALTCEHHGRVVELAVSSADIHADLDTPDDLRRWIAREDLRLESNGGPATNPLMLSTIGDGKDGPKDRAFRITLEVRLFAIARERAGRPTLALELPCGSCVAELRAEIAQRLPALASLLPRSLIAVNEEYAGEDHVLADGARVAVVPPVSGGGPDGAGGNDGHSSSNVV